MDESDTSPGWRGRLVALTGASAGVGRAVAARVISEGGEVILLARDPNRLAAVAAELGPRAHPLPTDVTAPDEVRSAFATVDERFGRLDVLMNVAGAARARRIEDASDADIGTVVGVNLFGPIHTTRAAIPLLRKAEGGDIVNVSSEITLDDLPMMSLYASSKQALDRFTRAMTKELRSDGIRVSLVVLGRTADTDFGSNFDDEDRRRLRAAWEEDGYTARIGSGRRMTLEEVTDALSFVATRPRGVMLDVVHVRASGLTELPR